MKISETNLNINKQTDLTQIRCSNKIEASAKKHHNSEKKSDTVTLSQAAKRVLEAKKLIESISDVRTEKIASLKNQIKNSKYEIKSEEIAENIIRESLTTELLIIGVSDTHKPPKRRRR